MMINPEDSVIRFRIRQLTQRQNVSDASLSQQMTNHGYPIHRQSVHAITHGHQKINKHMIDTLKIIFECERSELITDDSYEYLPDRAKRYARVARSNEPVKGITPELRFDHATDALRAVAALHRPSLLNDTRCAECQNPVPCQTAVITHGGLKGPKE